ncbi:MAG: DUF3883 domain-containing protein [Pirellulaceae bacterium]
MPAVVRNRDRVIGTRETVLTRYERITFEKDSIDVPGKPTAEFVCPGHPLLDATNDLIRERYRDLLKQGAVLVDPQDEGEEVRALFYLEHSIQDARVNPDGSRRIVSRQLQFVEIDSQTQAHTAGQAPYLDYRPLTDEEKPLIESILQQDWLNRDLEEQAVSYAVAEIVPKHLAEIRASREELIDRTRAAVKDRLTKEINHWDHRAEDLRAQELAGRTPRLNSAKARARADELQARLKDRMEKLDQERRLSPLPPVATGGALIVPAGLLAKRAGQVTGEPATFARETKRVEMMAMDAVLSAERGLGYEPRDVSDEKCGYDIESKIPGSGRLRFIEVKGRIAEASTVTVTKNEILRALNKPDDFILAIVQVDGETTGTPVYVRKPFTREPDFGVTSVNYNLGELLVRGKEPQ